MTPTKVTKPLPNKPGHFDGPIIRDDSDLMINSILKQIDKEIDWTLVKQEDGGLEEQRRTSFC